MGISHKLLLVVGLCLASPSTKADEEVGMVDPPTIIGVEIPLVPDKTPKTDPPIEEEEVETKGTYMVCFPTAVRPGFPIKVTVNILKEQKNPVNVFARLNSRDLEIDFLANKIINSDSSGVIEFAETVALDYTGSTSMNMTIYGIDNVTNEEIFRNYTSRMTYESKSFSVFIQTDKGIYQPGQTIKFRGIVVTHQLLPFVGTVTYTVLDPSNNVVLYKEDERLNNGVVQDEYAIPKRATGYHTIKIKVHNFEDSLSVNVYNYKLPKFKVELKPDSYVSPKSDGLSGTFKATYTFGEPVQGTATLEVFKSRWCDDNLSVVEKFPNFNGEASFFVPMKQLQDVFNYNANARWYSSDTVNVKATITDRNSGETFTETSSVRLISTHVKIEKISPPSTIKPGLDYVAYVKVTKQDGMPLDDDERESMIVETTISFSLPYNGQRWPSPIKQMVNQSIPRDGLVKIQVTAPNNNFTNARFEPKINGIPNEWSSSWTAYRFKSPSDSFIQVTVDDTDISPGQMVTVTVNANIPLPEYRLDILSRGKLIESKTHSSKSYSFLVLQDMTPTVRVVTSYVNPLNDEIIADSVKLSVKSTLQNQVSIELSHDEVDAGENVDITVTAHPQSFVGLLAVDQSVLLLDEGNDITQKRIFQDLDRYDPNNYGGYGWGRYWWPMPSTASDVTQIFHRSGMECLTDAFLYSQNYVAPKRTFSTVPGAALGQRAMRPQAFAMEAADMSDAVTAGPSDTSTAVRTEFPEAWLWEELKTLPNGKVTRRYKAPDTITTFELSSFALSEQAGLGLKVFRNFFVQLNIPPKVTRGEILIMRVTVFNYFDEDIDARVVLEKTEYIELDQTGNAEYNRQTTIPPNDAVTLIYPIKLIKVGRALIKVKAVTDRARDALERPITVAPEGIMKTITESVLIDRDGKETTPTRTTLPVNIPDNIVEGSEFITLYAYGDILGSSLSNLGNLLQMPGGCGEQNMLAFAPDVFITKYLESANKLTKVLKNKAYSHIRRGYSNQITYKRYDGSFSAFGSSDRSGSTWLTAFVTKCFLHAKKLDASLVQDSILKEAITFMMKQQDSNGVFKEPGRVIHSSMQGGVNSNITMTAYVLISLIENEFIYNPKEKNSKDTFNDDYMKAKMMAKMYLENQASEITDMYTLSIVTYALKLADSDKVDDLLDTLEKSAINDGSNGRYWTQKVQKEPCVGYRCYQSQSADIEMTAYVLLTYAKFGKSKFNIAFPIVRWLVAQRNSFGGYHSTQDTVIAIQALSEIASLMGDRNQRLSIQNIGTDDVTFDITDKNEIVLQSAQISNVTSDVVLEARGEGFGIAQLTVNYNIHPSETPEEAFKLDVTVTEVNTKKATVKVCARINTERTVPVEDVGMFLVTVPLPNGFSTDMDQTRLDNNNAKMVEMDGTDVNFYYDTVGAKDQCLMLTIERYMEIARMSPQVIKCLDYYKPERVSYREYVLPSLAIANVCDVCGSACPGCPAPAWGDWEDWENYCGDNQRKRYCKDSNGEMSKNCFGENMKSGLQTPFSCPTLSDGLYIDPNSAIYREFKNTNQVALCKAPRSALQSHKMAGLPSTYLDGISQYIVCDDNSFTQMMTRGNGFTIAFMFFPKEIKHIKPYTILSLGDSSGARISLSKQERSSLWDLKIISRNNEYLVNRISIAENEWQHITIVWSQNTGAKVYINGVSDGKSTKNSLDVPATITSDHTFNLLFGISHQLERDDTADYIKGMFNSLDVWNSELSMDEIQRHYNHYLPFTMTQDPLLSTAQVKHIVPRSIAGCFSKAIQASTLKARNKEVASWC